MAGAAGPVVRSGSDLGPLGLLARDVLTGDRFESRFEPAGRRTVEALVDSGWSKAAAARRLGIARQRVYERLAALSTRHNLDFDLPQTRIELALETWAVRMRARVKGDGRQLSQKKYRRQRDGPRQRATNYSLAHPLWPCSGIECRVESNTVPHKGFRPRMLPCITVPGTFMH